MLVHRSAMRPILQKQRVRSVTLTGKSSLSERLLDPMEKKQSRQDTFCLITEAEDLREKECFVRSDYQSDRI